MSVHSDVRVGERRPGRKPFDTVLITGAVGPPLASFGLGQIEQEHVMGKYFLGWLLGVPVVVLVAVWLFFG